MIVKLLTEPHLEFIGLNGGCTDSSESTHVKMPHCWKSHVTAQLSFPIFLVSGPAPPLPQLPDAFQTKLEINIIDKQTSFYTSEYYDRPNNRAVMYIIQNNKPYRIYMDYTNDQILTVIGK